MAAPIAEPQAGPRPQRRSLVFVAALLVASGALRIGDGAGRAWAEVSAQPAAGVAAEPVTGFEAGSAAGDMPAALLAALKDREAKLLAREATLDEREAGLAQARALAEQRISDMAAQEKALAKTLAIADDAAEGDVARLVAVYETMKAKDAIPLFAVMDADFAAGFLARMKPEPAAAILAGLDPKTAYTISAVLAGRNARAPKN